MELVKITVTLIAEKEEPAKLEEARRTFEEGIVAGFLLDNNRIIFLLFSGC